MAVIDLRATTDDDPQARLVAATLRCIARWGVAKTTLDDVAKEAGISRATAYRLVPGGKDNLLLLVSISELNRFFLALDEAVKSVHGLEDTLVAGITTATRHLEQHGALKFLIEHEPDQILPRFAFHNLDRILANVRVMAGPYLEPYLGDVAGRTAEWLARIVLSYACAPSPEFTLSDEESARHMVRTYVLPGLNQSQQSQKEVV